jgi:hypothetical protein
LLDQCVFLQGELDDEALASEIGLNKIQRRKLRAMLHAAAADATTQKRLGCEDKSKASNAMRGSSSSSPSQSSACAAGCAVELPLPSVWARALAARASDDPPLPAAHTSTGLSKKPKKQGAARAKETAAAAALASGDDENEDPTAEKTAAVKKAGASTKVSPLGDASDDASDVHASALPPRVRVTSRGGWGEQRLGQRIDAPLDCLLAVARAVALAEASGSSSSSGGEASASRQGKIARGTAAASSTASRALLAGSLLDDRAGAFGAVQHAVRKLRSGWVNAGEAAALCLELRRLQATLPRTARLACAATSAAQALLLEATLQLLAAHDASLANGSAGNGGGGGGALPAVPAVPIRVVPRDLAAFGASPDVLLVSFTHTAPSQGGGQAQRRGGGGAGGGRAAVARSVEAVRCIYDVTQRCSRGVPEGLSVAARPVFGPSSSTRGFVQVLRFFFAPTDSRIFFCEHHLHQVRHLVAWGARHQVHVFVSPGTAHASLHRWACAGATGKRALNALPASSPAPCFARLGRLLLAPPSTSSSGSSSGSRARGSALGAPANQVVSPGDDWVSALLANLRSIGGGREADQPHGASSVDATLWRGVWRGRGVRGIANYDAIVLCHDRAREPASAASAPALAAGEEALWADAVLLALPCALRASGWAKVVHVFEADLHALKGGDDHRWLCKL